MSKKNLKQMTSRQRQGQGQKIKPKQAARPQTRVQLLCIMPGPAPFQMTYAQTRPGQTIDWAIDGEAKLFEDYKLECKNAEWLITCLLQTGWKFEPGETVVELDGQKLKIKSERCIGIQAEGLVNRVLEIEKI